MNIRNRKLGFELYEDRTLLSASSELVANINQEIIGASSSPNEFVVIDEWMYFVAD